MYDHVGKFADKQLAVSQVVDWSQLMD